MAIAIQMVNLLAQLATILIITQVIMSYFMSPYHPLRRAIDNLVEPLLGPIRRILPQTGMLDFSPLVLIILVQIIARVLVGLLVKL